MSPSGHRTGRTRDAGRPAATALAARCFRPGRLVNPIAAAKYTLRSLALPLPPTKQGDPRTAGPTRTTRRDGKSSPGQHLWRRTRHGGNSADLCWQQPTTPALRGCLRFAVRAAPIPASSGKTNRHRLNRGGDRQASQLSIVSSWLDFVMTNGPRPTCLAPGRE